MTADRATPNLPSRDFAATSAFYAALGFGERYRDDGWMILTRGPIELEFFRDPGVDPYSSNASCCVRVSDVDALHAAFTPARMSAEGIPRMTRPANRPWGLREFAVVDPDGNLLRCLGPTT